jgi:hypothetical protein
MSKRLAQSLLLGGLMLLPVKGVQAEPPEDPIYVKTSNGWNAAYAHGSEYEFRVMGNGTKISKVRRCGKLENRQNASANEKGAR